MQLWPCKGMNIAWKVGGAVVSEDQKRRGKEGLRIDVGGEKRDLGSGENKGRNVEP